MHIGCVIFQVLMALSMAFVIVSILETILESHYMFRVVYEEGRPLPAPDPLLYYTKEPTLCSNNTSNSTETQEVDDHYPHTEPHPYLSTIDDACLVSIH